MRPHGLAPMRFGSTFRSQTPSLTSNAQASGVTKGAEIEF